MPGELNTMRGGRRNIIFDLNEANNYHETNPYAKAKNDAVLTYKETSLISPITTPIANSLPARYLYHLPGEINYQMRDGTRNILYDRPSVQTGLSNIRNAMTGTKSSNPYLKTSVIGENGYKQNSMMTNIFGNNSQQFEFK